MGGAAADNGEKPTLRAEVSQRDHNNPDQRLQALSLVHQRHGDEGHQKDLDRLRPLLERKVGNHGEEVGEGHPDDEGEHRSEEHTSELQSLMRISYAVFCLKKKK